MPWERSSLWLAEVDGADPLRRAQRVAGASPDEGRAVSFFQPIWAGQDLVVANDRSGFWNLEGWSGATQPLGDLPTGPRC